MHTSFLQRLRPTARTFRALLPLYPAAIESFDLSGYDLVVSSSSAWAHAVLCDERHRPRELLPQPVPLRLERPRPDAGPRATRSRAAFLRALVPALAPVGLDRRPAHRPLRRELADHPGADPRLLRAARPTVVHPPVDTSRFSPGPRRRPLRGRLRADAAQADRRRRSRRSTSCGGRWSSSATAPTARGLQPQAGPTIQFAGRVSDAAVAGSCSGARALVVTAVEEFGIAAVESQAAGRPVIARRGGGALETVVDGVDRLLLVRRPVTSWPRPCGDSTTRRSTPRPASRNAARFDVATLPRGRCRARSSAAVGDGSRRGARAPAAASTRGW